MKIRKIDIIGFKSFMDKATISFPTGISAIVGPNGCGKSNVIDALRWVMGEQSVKQLRGKSMEDIIFAGANTKAPLNMAEVTLTLANDNGHAPEEFRDYSEISVTRRLFRSGESAYMINRQPCRLKDIYALFMGSGVGTRTFSIIQQGNIGAIIDAGPDERRLFIEEAAGVTRYKFRKNEALRKVKATGQNLLRINDIIVEVNRQMAGLRRQAKKAERFQIYQQRVNLLDTHLLLHYHDDYTRQMNEAQSLLKELKDKDIAQATNLKKIDAAIEVIKLKRQQKDQEIATQKSSKFDSQRKIDRTEADLSHLKSEIQRLHNESIELEHAQTDLAEKSKSIESEVGDVQEQNKALEADIQRYQSQIDHQRSGTRELQDQLNQLNSIIDQNKSSLMNLVAEEARFKNIYQNASNNKDALRRRLTRIDEDVAVAQKQVEAAETEKDRTQQELQEIQESIAELGTQIDQIKQTLTARATELGAQVKKTQTLELERNQARSQLTTLNKMATNFEWYKDGVKAVMQANSATTESGTTQQCPLAGVVGLLADVIEPEAEYETAVEAVLGEALQYILVQDQAAGSAAIDFLQSRNAGRSGFIPMTAVEPLNGSEQSPIPRENRLLEHLRVQPDCLGIAKTLLGHVALADDMGQALALFNQNGRTQTIVTKDGNVVSHQGILIGGSQEQLSGILAKKQELKALENQCAELDASLEEAKNHQQEMEKIVRQLETELQHCISDKNAAADEAVEAEKALYRKGEDLKNARRHYELVELEQEQLLGEESDLDDEMAKYNKALAKITSQVEQAQSQTAQTTESIVRISSQLERENQKVVDLKLQLTTFQTKLENGTQTLNRLREFGRDSRIRLDQLQKEILLKKEKHQQSKSRVSVKENDLKLLYDRLKDLDHHLNANESEYKAIDAHLQDHDEQMAQIRTGREKTMEKIRLLELDLSEKRIRRDNIAAKVQEKYHLSIAALRMKQAQQEAEEIQMSIGEMEKELERFRVQISKIGDVNLGAIKEYEELKERFEFLNRQRSDLESAIEDLHKVIRKINRITQQRFIETFDQVNVKLHEVFPRLFEGGSARLELTEPGKPLETGVEFLVHPPGKKLTRMSLLSGGEKALSAIAFIFAIFLMRPASFCLLDEIDAPLDEANVVRFNNLMKVIGKKSQIIMITHNKKSMEFAETLFGVTMEQKGISKIVSVNLNEKHA
ncbi:MAG: chromosome segregation protein SMC [Desulfobacteraceae bacterium]|jgi:chromosome segregation protein